MVGRDLLVAPLFAGDSARKVVLPKGKWYDFYTGKFVGEEEVITVAPGLNTIPVFVRDGGIVPLAPPTNKIPTAKQPLEVRFYGEKPSSYSLYDDDGDSYDYENGAYTRIQLQVTNKKGKKQGKVIIPKGAKTWSYSAYNFRFMVNEFLPNGQLIVYLKGKAFPRKDIYTNGTGTCINSPVVVLTDELSASASEIFSGAIQDNDRGLIIGRRTFGKGLVQSAIDLNDGSEIRLTIARYYTPSGRCIQKPYSLGDEEDYEQDIYNRFMHGEFDSADSIHQDNVEKYKTKNGRIVYGGGGIMPDVFIPRDTIGVTSYFTNVVNSGMVSLYALEYSEHNHDKLASFKTYQEMFSYLKRQPLLNDFTNFAATKGIPKRPMLINVSAQLIEKQIWAYIVRNFFDNAGFYPVYLSDDVTLQKAVKLIASKNLSPIRH